MFDARSTVCGPTADGMAAGRVGVEQVGTFSSMETHMLASAVNRPKSEAALQAC